jgi:hypothetical protein
MSSSQDILGATFSMRLVFALALGAVPLGGCDRIFVSTEAEFSDVDIACVDTAIRTAPGVVGVDHSSEAGKAPQRVGADEIEIAETHSWKYFSEEPAYVTLARAGRRWRFTSMTMQWGTAWTSTELTAFDPKMAAIHEALARNCGLRIPREITVDRD